MRDCCAVLETVIRLARPHPHERHELAADPLGAVTLQEYERSMPTRARLLVLPMLVALTACPSKPGSLSNSEAKKQIEAIWNVPDVGLVLGQIKFVDVNFLHRAAEASRGEDVWSELRLYHAFVDKGLIAVGDERELGGNQARETGVWKTASVAITDKGRSAGEVKKAGNFEELWLTVGHSKIVNIVTNDSIVIGANRYRVVMGTHTFDVPDDLRAAFGEARPSVGRERKFKVLLNYDPFKNSWGLGAMDMAPQAGEFQSSNVDNRLAQLRLCGSSNC